MRRTAVVLVALGIGACTRSDAPRTSVAAQSRCPAAQDTYAPAGAQVEFITIMWFDSLDAVRTFAGADHEAAVAPPSARTLLTRFDARSAHYRTIERRTR